MIIIYILVLCCIVYLIVMALLKIKYRFWYSQPLSFRFSPYLLLYRFIPSFMSSSSSSYFTSIQNNLSNTRVSTYNNTKIVVYPFIQHVNYTNICVYSNYDNIKSTIYRCTDVNSIPFGDIVKLLNNQMTMNIYNSNNMNNNIVPYFDFDRFSQSITGDTHGLSPFVGIYYRRSFNTTNNTDTITKSDITSDDIHDLDEVQGVSVLLPRQKIEYDINKKSQRNAILHKPSNKLGILDDDKRICTIYVCEHLAWNRVLLQEPQSIELLETTEYIQKSREIAGEQTLYKYSSIPLFVVPFTTCYSYGISIDRINVLGSEYERKNMKAGILLVKVSSVNIDMFYNFINECSIDFRCSIQNVISHIQHLVDKNVYHIYMLVMNKTLVLSTYIFGPSWTRCIQKDTSNVFITRPVRKMRSHRDRIEKVREHIVNTSTALVKYLPPVDRPIYDISGKRINTKSIEHIELNDRISAHNHTTTIPKLISSIQKCDCDLNLFLYGFFSATRDLAASLNLSTQSNNNNIMVIDTIAHNYRIIDEINRHFAPLWIDKWYYIMYNANIHQELLCKDLFMV